MVVIGVSGLLFAGAADSAIFVDDIGTGSLDNDNHYYYILLPKSIFIGNLSCEVMVVVVKLVHSSGGLVFLGIGF